MTQEPDATRLARRRQVAVDADIYLLREVPGGLWFGAPRRSRPDELVDEDDMLVTMVDEFSERSDSEETEAVDIPVRRQLGEPTLRLLQADEAEDVAPPERAAEEFLCTSCFLLRPSHLLADPRGMRCVDCASA